jgi:hypothetical protein
MVRRRSKQAGPIEDGILEEDLLFQTPKRWAWLEPELLGERHTHAGVGAQRVGLATTAVERRDERGPQPLAEWVLADEGFELGDDLCGATEVEPRSKLVLDETEAGFVEPDAVRDDPFAIARVRKHVTVEHRQRRRTELDRGRRIARSRLRCFAGEAEHLDRVDRFLGDVQDVPGPRPRDECCIAERPSQP